MHMTCTCIRLNLHGSVFGVARDLTGGLLASFVLVGWMVYLVQPPLLLLLLLLLPSPSIDRAMAPLKHTHTQHRDPPVCYTLLQSPSPGSSRSASRAPEHVRAPRGVGPHQDVAGRVEDADGLHRVHVVTADGGDLEPGRGRVDLDAARLLEGADDEGVGVLGVPVVLDRLGGVVVVLMIMDGVPSIKRPYTYII